MMNPKEPKDVSGWIPIHIFREPNSYSQFLKTINSHPKFPGEPSQKTQKNSIHCRLWFWSTTNSQIDRILHCLIDQIRSRFNSKKMKKNFHISQSSSLININRSNSSLRTRCINGGSPSILSVCLVARSICVWVWEREREREREREIERERYRERVAERSCFTDRAMVKRENWGLTIARSVCFTRACVTTLKLMSYFAKHMISIIVRIIPYNTGNPGCQNTPKVFRFWFPILMSWFS